MDGVKEAPTAEKRVFTPPIFCMQCGTIFSPDKHHLDCPTRKGLVWNKGKWVKQKKRRASTRSALP